MESFKDAKIELRVIKGLQVKDRKKFNEGMSNLITEIYKIAGGSWDNVIINITGGYKATIPFLTILAQVNRCRMYYIFEETDSLIKIPYIPIDVKWKIFEENEKFFFDLEKEKVREIDKTLQINQDIDSLLEFADNLYSLNPLGVALWERYKSDFEFFYISKEVEDYLNRYTNRKEIFEKSVCELKRRLKENPNHPDLNHILSGISLPEGFKTFKHKEQNLQVRILYKNEPYKTIYNTEEIALYIGLVAIGSEVHNAENEYVDLFKKFGEKVKDIGNYNFKKIYKNLKK